TMQYDPVGNLAYDNYTGAGTRTYDAENRMVSAQTGGSQSASYTYDADGRRVRRNDGAGSGEVWQVYGAGGELLAEYAAGSSPYSPQKEYGYRGGELLVTAGAAAGGWGPAPSFTGPDPLQHGDAIKLEHLTQLRSAVNQLRQRAGLADYVFTADPNPERNVTAVKAEHIRQLRAALEGARSRLGLSTGGYAHLMLYENSSPIYAGDFQELRDQIREAWAAGSGGGGTVVRWLVSDQLGTPRMAVDRTGSLAGVRRHDYLPFGEELQAGAGGRTAAQGYGAVDNVRQKFTSKERDQETNLDYFGARYYSAAQGRFVAPDYFNGNPAALYNGPDRPSALPFASILNPQTLNLYAYVNNNPVSNVDEDGHRGGKQHPVPGSKGYTYRPDVSNVNDSPNLHIFNRKGVEIGRVAIKGQADNLNLEWTGDVPSSVKADIEALIRSRVAVGKWLPRPPLHEPEVMEGEEAPGAGRGLGESTSRAFTGLLLLHLILEALGQANEAKTY
ncbi:MAG TPA: RHS repeat-associated core domain-containing protein, partial [Pyrinomonadaceae bacterium]|nr:RHS repeat-associated core domain-containing protein [Pyrinomonadaceae bacterium]